MCRCRARSIPRAVFKRLFGPRDDAGHPLPQSSRADDQSLLDLALGRRQRPAPHALAGPISTNSTNTSIPSATWSAGSAPRRLALPVAGGRRPAPTNLTPPPANVPRNNPRELVRLMLDMIVLAFWTDTTRISTFMFANDVSGRNFSFLDGVRESHHESSHHANQQAKIDQYKIIVRWHVEQFVYLLKRLRDDPGRRAQRCWTTR